MLTHVGRRSASAVALAVLFVTVAIFAAGGEAAAGPASVGLGTATSFAVLAGSTVTNTGATVVSGDLGVSPGTAVTGFPPGTVNNGTTHSADAVAAQAQADTTTAYNDAAGRASNFTVSSDLGGQTLVAGVYTGGALSLTGTVTLDAQNDPSAVFILRAASTLTTATNSTVALLNGASSCNVFWKVGSSATLFTNTHFVGTVLALTSIAAQTGTTVAGRLLARNGEVTLDSNTIRRSPCVVAPTTTTTSVAPTTTSAGPTTTLAAGPTTTSAGPTTTLAAGPTTTSAGPTTTLAAGPTTTAVGSTTTSVGPTTTTASTIVAAATTTTASTIAPLTTSTTTAGTTTTRAGALAAATPPRTITASPTSGSAGGSSGSESSESPAATPATATNLALTGPRLSGWQLAQLAIGGALAFVIGAAMLSAARAARPRPDLQTGRPAREEIVPC